MSRVRGNGGDRLAGREHGLDNVLLTGDIGARQRRQSTQGRPGGGASGGVPAHAVHDDECGGHGEVAVLIDGAQPTDIRGRTDDGYDEGVALRPGCGQDLAH